MRKGYDVFGTAYGYMLRKDPHNANAIEHKLMRNQTIVDEDSIPLFYEVQVKHYEMENHELYGFSQQFRKENGYDSVKAVLEYTSRIASEYDVDIEDMLFGGTESEILKRGTDWCFDMARAAAVLLDCIEIPARLVFVANPYKAYHGHVLVEAYYSGSWGLIDPIFGYLFSDGKPVPAKGIFHSRSLQDMEPDYRNMFEQIAICEYDPTDKTNQYIVSKCNDYTYKLNTMKQDGSWLLGEA